VGLSISNALAIKLSGSDKTGIDVRSNLNDGSRFSFYVDRNQKLDVQNTSELFLKISSNVLGDGMFDAHSPVNRIPEFRTNSLCISRRSMEYLIFNEISPTHSRSPSKQMTLMPPSCLCPKILVVDDDGFNIMAMECLLKQLNLTCDVAYNGKEAIEKVKKRTAGNTTCGATCSQYTLIFMDCSMPIMNGFETTRALKSYMEESIIPYIWIVACTAFTTNDKIQECRDCGMDDYISKPLSKTKLSEILNKYHAK